MSVWNWSSCPLACWAGGCLEASAPRLHQHITKPPSPLEIQTTYPQELQTALQVKTQHITIPFFFLLSFTPPLPTGGLALPLKALYSGSLLSYQFPHFTINKIFMWGWEKNTVLQFTGIIMFSISHVRGPAAPLLLLAQQLTAERRNSDSCGCCSCQHLLKLLTVP